MKTMKTGAAGFIGFHTAKRVLERGDTVVSVDNVNDYYDPALKEERPNILHQTAADTGTPFRFVRANRTGRQAVEANFTQHQFDRVIHLAAKAGVRYSLENPHAYFENNLVMHRIPTPTVVNLLKSWDNSPAPS